MHVAAISKIKVSDILSNNVILLKEKGSKIIKRKLLLETSNKIKELINECEINIDDYFFNFFKFKDNQNKNKRTLFFIKKLRNLFYESGSFSISSVESLSSHIFRSSYSVNNYKNIELNEIKEKMGHKYIYTNINSYINPERRGLNFNEEENNFKHQE